MNLLKIAIFVCSLATYVKSNVIFSKANVRAEEENLYRLQKSVVPESYDIKLTVKKEAFIANLSELDPTFTGDVTINIKAIENVEKFRIHADKNFKDIKITSKPAIFNFSSPLPDYEQIEINLKPTLLQNQTLTLTIKYTGLLYEDLYGYYRSYYNDETNTVR